MCPVDDWTAAKKKFKNEAKVNLGNFRERARIALEAERRWSREKKVAASGEDVTRFGEGVIPIPLRMLCRSCCSAAESDLKSVTLLSVVPVITSFAI